MANNIKESLEGLMRCDGAIYAVLVDAENGMVLGQSGGGGLDLEMLAAVVTEIVRADRKASKMLENLGGGAEIYTEDIVFTQPGFFHVVAYTASHPGLFVSIGIDRSKGNAALARRMVQEMDKKLVL